MHSVVLFAITAVMLASYLVELGAPAAVKFTPEMLSIIVTIYVVFAGIRTRFQFIRIQYWILFGSILVAIVFGIFANSVAVGPIIAGMRYALRPIPFFFLPAVYWFKEWEIRQQLRLICAFSMMQLPIAVYQRYKALNIGSFSGDTVYGTVAQSGPLTIFLVAAICCLIAMFQARRISTATFVALFLILFLPTTINETKITVFILPISVMITIFMTTAPGRRLRTLGLGALVLTIAGALFVPIYDYLGRQNVSDRDVSSIGDMFTQRDYLEKYLNQDTQVGDKKKEVGRVDAFTVPLSTITSDPIWAAFGLGLGNVAVSSLGSQFSGAYSATLGRYATGATSAGALLIELGLMGFIGVLGLYWLIFRDSVAVAKDRKNLVAILATAWPSVIFLAMSCMFYTATVIIEALSYFFWYFSGLIAAERMHQIYREKLSASTPPATTPEIRKTNIVG